MLDAIDREILDILSQDARAGADSIAAQLRQDAGAVRERIARMEKERVIVKYKTLIHPDCRDEEKVTALIEVCVCPEMDLGFDAIAERIYRHQQVQAVWLMSGDYDLMVLIEGRTMREIAYFVADKLSVLQGVRSTATHFVLKKYKDDGEILEGIPERPERLVIVP